jgi:hypothetical protein
VQLYQQSSRGRIWQESVIFCGIFCFCAFLTLKRLIVSNSSPVTSVCKYLHRLYLWVVLSLELQCWLLAKSYVLIFVCFDSSIFDLFDVSTDFDDSVFNLFDAYTVFDDSVSWGSVSLAVSSSSWEWRFLYSYERYVFHDSVFNLFDAYTVFDDSVFNLFDAYAVGVNLSIKLTFLF